MRVSDSFEGLTLSRRIEKMAEGNASGLVYLARFIVLLIVFQAAQCLGFDDNDSQGRHEAYILTQNPSGISVVDTQRWKLSGNIPLDDDYEPRWGLSSPDGRVLYVIGDRKILSQRPEPSDPAKLWLVDLAERRVSRAIPIAGKGS